MAKKRHKLNTNYNSNISSLIQILCKYNTNTVENRRRKRHKLNTNYNSNMPSLIQIQYKCTMNTK